MEQEINEEKYRKSCALYRPSKSVCNQINNKIWFSKSSTQEQNLSHNNPCFPFNTAITNFLVSNTCEIKFHDVIGQSTVPMYTSAKILKHG